MSIAPVPHTTRLHRSGPEARSRLETLGLGGVDLLDLCVQGFTAAVNQYTPFAPLTALGLLRWIGTVSATRTALDGQGWETADPSNAPRSISPSGDVAIAAVGGDRGTGLETGAPRNARARGTTFRSEVKHNALVSGIGPATIPLALDLPGSTGRSTWVLLYHWDKDAQALRAELSLPVAIDNGWIVQWAERILLGSSPLTGVTVDTPLDGLPDSDVDFEILAV